VIAAGHHRRHCCGLASDAPNATDATAATAANAYAASRDNLERAGGLSKRGHFLVGIIMRSLLGSCLVRLLAHHRRNAVLPREVPRSLAGVVERAHLNLEASERQVDVANYRCLNDGALSLPICYSMVSRVIFHESGSRNQSQSYSYLYVLKASKVMCRYYSRVLNHEMNSIE
jgi:hypothetical protein